jgi:hypothetical protein
MGLVPVGDDATTTAARRLIAKYLSWVAGVYADRHSLVFDTEAMLSSDIGDRGRLRTARPPLPHDDNATRRYQDERALGACRDSAVFMALRLR